MHLVAVLIAAFLLAAALSSRPFYAVIVFVALRVFVPASAGPVVTGDWQGAVALHAGTIYWLVAFAMILARDSRPFSLEFTRRHVTYALLAAITIWFAALTVLQRDPLTLAAFLNAWVAPILAAFVVRAVCDSEPRGRRHLTSAILLIALAESVLGVAQWVTQQPLVWQSVQPSFWSRPSGTFDSALDFAFFLAVSVPLCVGLRRPWLAMALGAVLVFTILLSESRSPLIFSLVGLASLLVRRRFRLGTRAMALALFATLAFYFGASRYTEGIFARFQGEDGSSLSARTIVYRYLLDHLGETLFLGRGWGWANDLKGAVFQTSLESAYGIFVLELGLLVTAALFAIHVRRVWPARGNALEGSRLALLGAIVLNLGFSGFTTMGATSVVLWLVFGMADMPSDAEGEVNEISKIESERVVND